MVVVLALTKVVKIPKNIFLIREKELFCGMIFAVAELMM